MPKKEQSNATKPNKKIIIITLAVVAVVLIAGASFTGVAYSTVNGIGEQIAKGIKISGFDVGTMSVDEAKAATKEKINTRFHEMNVNFMFGDDTKTVSLFELVKEVNIDEAFDAAYKIGREGNAFQKYIAIKKAAKGSVDLIPKVEADEVAVITLIDDFVKDIKEPLEQSGYTIEGNKLILSNGMEGNALDKDKATQDVTALINKAEGGDIKIEVIKTMPDKFDVEKLYTDVCRDPINANYEVKDGKGVFTKAEPGYSFDKEEAARVLKENETNSEKYSITLKLIDPKIKDSDVLGNLFSEEVASFSSQLASAGPERYNNVKIAAKSVNGTVLNPGDVFSYNAALGPVTAARGYQVATVFANGTMEKGIGGGVCQVSSTIYCAVLYANLEVVTRYNHSLPVGYVPLGQDATVSSGPVDFRFRNTTGYPMKVVATLEGSRLTIRLMGFNPNKNITVKMENITVSVLSPGVQSKVDPSLPAGKVVVDQGGSNGYVVDTYKNIYDNGKLIKREYISRSTYKAISRIERTGSGTDTPAPSGDPNASPSSGATPNPAEATSAPAETTKPTETTKPATTPDTPVVTKAPADKTAEPPKPTAVPHVVTEKPAPKPTETSE